MGFDDRSITAGLWGGDVPLKRTVVASVFSLLSRKGFRDVGLSGAVVGCKLKPALTGDGRPFAGEALRLRKGLFEGSVGVVPGDDCFTGPANKVLSVLAEVQVVSKQDCVVVCARFQQEMKQATWECGNVVDDDASHLHGA